MALTHSDAFQIPLVIQPKTYAYAGLTVVAAGIASALRFAELHAVAQGADVVIPVGVIGPHPLVREWHGGQDRTIGPNDPRARAGSAPPQVCRLVNWCAA